MPARAKVPVEIAQLAREHAPEAIEVLAAALQSESPKDSVQAAIALLDRGFGRPKQQTELSGPEGAPIAIDLNDKSSVREIVRALKFIVEKGKRAGD